MSDIMLAGEPLPWVPELQAGIWRSPGEVVKYPDPTPLEEEIWWGAALALGFSGFNLYMLANRENWELAPLAQDGRRSDFLDPVDRLVSMAQQLPSALTAPAAPAVVVAWHRPDAYDADTANPYQQWDATLARLTELGVPYDLWDTATELTAPLDLPLVVPARSGVDRQTLAKVRATGRQIIELTEPASDLHELAFSAPGIVGPQGREPRTLVGLRHTSDACIVHVIHWGHGVPDATLHLRDQPDGHLTCFSTGEPIPFRSGTAALPVVPGHRVYTLEFRRSGAD
jgi:hypothetical protein